MRKFSWFSQKIAKMAEIGWKWLKFHQNGPKKDVGTFGIARNVYIACRGLMFYGAPTMDLSKKKPPLLATRKCSETVGNQAFSASPRRFQKNQPRESLRLSINLQKPLGTSMNLKVWPATIQQRRKRTWDPQVDAHEGHSAKPLEFLRFPASAG